MPKVNINMGCPSHDFSKNTDIAENVILSENTRKVLQALQELQNNADSLSSLSKQGIISDVGTAIYEMSKQKFKLKEDFVLQVHKNKISEVPVKKNGTMTTVYQTRMPDKSRPGFISYEGLINHLFQFYTSGDSKPKKPPEETDYSFKTIFEKAVEEKKLRDNPKERTIRDYQITYDAYITKQFEKKDIRRITASEIDAFILKRLHAVPSKEKRLLKFKGILNLVFSYALDPEHRYIEVNPVRTSNMAFKKHCIQASNKPEDKALQPDQVQKLKDYVWNRVGRLPYDVNGYAILFATSSGVRVGEIPSLKWSDVTDNAIHIHSQQNDTYDPNSTEVKNSPYVTKAGKTYSYYNPTTKNEKGVSDDGRYFPMTKELKEIFDALREKQKSLSIKSKFVFCKSSGEWITVRGYTTALGKIAKKLELDLSNNHALRMSYNSYVLTEKWLGAPDRAKLLGHSVETNLRNYTFSKSDEYLDELRAVLDGDVAEKAEAPDSSWLNEDEISTVNAEIVDLSGKAEVSTPQYLTFPDCTEKKKNPSNREFKGILNQKV